MTTLLILAVLIVLPTYVTVRLVRMDRSNHPPVSHADDVFGDRTSWPDPTRAPGF